MEELTLGEAEMIGIILHTVLYGIYFVLFIGSIYLPTNNRVGREVNKGLMGVTIILFLLITSHWIIQVIRLFEAYVHGLGGAGGPTAYYGQSANPKNLAKTMLYVLQSFVGDLTMTYRLYVVWNRNKYIVLLPVLMSTALLGTGSAVVWSFSQLKPHENIFLVSAGRWVMCVFAMSIATNLTVTSLIAYRILRMRRAMKGIKVAGTSMTTAIEIILESAGLYTLCLLVTMSGYISKKSYQFITLDATSPCIGIAFTLIIVRVCLGIGRHDTSADLSTNAIRNRFPTILGSSSGHRESMPGVRVDVTRVRVRDSHRPRSTYYQSGDSMGLDTVTFGDDPEALQKDPRSELFLSSQDIEMQKPSTL